MAVRLQLIASMEKKMQTPLYFKIRHVVSLQWSDLVK